MEDGPDAARGDKADALSHSGRNRTADVAGTAPIMPQSLRLRDMCERIASEPGQPLDLDAWATRAGMSRMAFTRTFRLETGLSPSKWYQQLRTHHIDGMLEQGTTLQQLAFRLGYPSPAIWGELTAGVRAENRSLLGQPSTRKRKCAPIRAAHQLAV